MLKEIGDMGRATEDLTLGRNAMFAEVEEAGEEEEDVFQEENRTTVSLLKKKKRLLTSDHNSFFSGCTPIREES